MGLLRVGVTMRGTERFGERFYSIPLGIINLVEVEAQAEIVPLLPSLSSRMDANRCSALIFSGGETMGDNLERDSFENDLLAEAVQRSVRVIGICRGFQLIASFFGATIAPIAGHVATRRPLNQNETDIASVTCFHNFSVVDARIEPSTLVTAADDGCVEGGRFSDTNCLGMMWHPEREPLGSPASSALTKAILN